MAILLCLPLPSLIFATISQIAVASVFESCGLKTIPKDAALLGVIAENRVFNRVVLPTPFSPHMAVILVVKFISLSPNPFIFLRMSFVISIFLF
jgi:hypothetical protein